MDIRPGIQIQSMIKAMIDVVLPAVDAEHKMAQEQARLVVATLQLMAQRFPLMFRYDRDELDRYVELSEDLVKQVKGGEKTRAAVDGLSACTARGAEVLDRARAEPIELEAALFDLRAKVGELIQSVHKDGEPASAALVNHRVLAASKVQLDRERAWLIMMGFEANPSAIPAIESQLKLPKEVE